MSVLFNRDPQFYPLFLKFAADQFQKNNAGEGLRFFELACGGPRGLENQVYEQIYKIHQQASKIPFSHIQDREYGRKAFHGADRLSSTALEKAMAIETVWRQKNRAELGALEAKIHECLWELHGRPEGDPEYGKNAFNCMHGKYATFDEKLSAISYAENPRVHVLGGWSSIDGAFSRVEVSIRPPAPEEQRVQSPVIAREINDIKTILNSSTVYVNFIGNRHLVSDHESFDMDAIVERLKIVSRKSQYFTRSDRENGLECVEKIRAFYLQSDDHFFAKTRMIFDLFICIITIPYQICRFFSGGYRDYSQRECIEANGFESSVGPESIELNFHRKE